MRKIFRNLCKCSVIAIVATIVGTSFTNAAVTPRQTNANKAAAARVPNRIATSAPKKSVATTQEPEPEPEPVVVSEPEPEPEKPIVVDNKTSMFQDVLSEIGASTTDRAAQERAEMIRRQRELLAQQEEGLVATQTNMGSANACDTGLRQCMTEKCGDGFTKCANDSTVIWNTKMDSCRNKTKCSGREYSILAPEILADRDLNVQLAHYDGVIKCGNKYNKCIFGECGTTLEKCLSKKDGDAAISKCATIANECKSMDNGLASRAMNVFGDLRKIATARVPKDEQRLYELRDLMRTQCNRLGAAFDDRTLDCVYTVSFFVGEDHTLMASKKLYPAQSFQCNPNWFDIDVTTFKENAYRLTRSQKSASSALLGAGLGIAGGFAASGAIGRGMKTHEAKKAVKEACEDMGTGYKWDGKKCTDDKGKEVKVPTDDHNCTGTQTWDGTKCVDKIDKNGGGQDNSNPEQTDESIETSESKQIEKSEKSAPAPVSLLSEDDPGMQKILQTSHGGLSYSVPSKKTGNNDNLPPVDKAYTTHYYCQIYPKKCPEGTPISVSWGQWRVDFKDPDISLKGVSVCSIPTSQEYLQERWTKRDEIDHEKSLGKNCYCKLVLSDKTSEWILATDPAFTHVTFDDHTACTKDCPVICTAAFRLPVFRKKMYDTLTKR